MPKAHCAMGTYRTTVQSAIFSAVIIFGRELAKVCSGRGKAGKAK